MGDEYFSNLALFILMISILIQYWGYVSGVELLRSKRFADPDAENQEPGRRPGNRRTVCGMECACEMPRAECRKANLRSIPSPFPKGIEEIIIAENPINIIRENSFYKEEFASVTNLQLNDNHIKTLEAKAFNGLGNLRALSIKGNKIKKIDEMVFYGLRNLETLTLSSNQLKELLPSSFPYGIGITSIRLKDNKLQYLSSEFFEGLPSLKTLSLGGNPWNCDCDLLGLFVWLQLANTKLLEPEAKCEKPPNVAGKTLHSFTNAEMQKACIDDDGKDDEEAVDDKIDEACAEHNSSNAVHICFISGTVFAQPGKKACLHCAATVEPAEIERDLSEETGNEIIYLWEAEHGKESKNDTSDGMICFEKVQVSDAGTYTCVASFGNTTDERIVSLIVNDLANKVGIGIAIFFGSFIVILLLLLLRWWTKEVRAFDKE